MTLLDLVGAYDALRRVRTMDVGRDVVTRIVGTTEAIEDDTGTVLRAHGVFDDLAAYDLLVVPGGRATRRLVDDARVIDYLRSWGGVRPIASVCTGALLIGRAGHLAGLRATTH